jgi:hypothetical protein
LTKKRLDKEQYLKEIKDKLIKRQAVNDTADKRLTSMKGIMISKGMKHIGGGAYGHTFRSKHDGSVIKIFKPDKGYTNFLQYVKENKDDIHLPKIRKLAQFKHMKNKGLSLIKLEKLHPIDMHDVVQIRDYVFGSANPNFEKAFKEDKPSLARSLRKLVSHSEKHRSTVRLDLNKNNIMKRTNGDIVITDPFAPAFRNVNPRQIPKNYMFDVVRRPN